jgi:uncharacterized protein (TIGR00369 family)
MTTSYDLTSMEGVQALLDMSPIHRLLGFRLVAMDRAAGTIEITASTTGDSARSDGAAQAHGGAVATLIDSTATFACSVMLGHPVPTMNLRVDYLRPADGGEMRAIATVRRAGRTVTLVDVDVMAGDKLAAIGRCVLASAQG